MIIIRQGVRAWPFGNAVGLDCVAVCGYADVRFVSRVEIVFQFLHGSCLFCKSKTESTRCSNFGKPCQKLVKSKRILYDRQYIIGPIKKRFFSRSYRLRMRPI